MLAYTDRTGASTVRNGAQVVCAFPSVTDESHNTDGGFVTGLALDRKQNILAVDNDGGVVKVFDQQGCFKYSFGKGLLVEPWDIFVTSSGMTHVHLFTSHPIADLYCTCMYTSDYGIFFQFSGKIGVSDTGAGDIKIFSHSGKYLLRSERGFHVTEPCGIDYHSLTKQTLLTDKTFACVFVHGPSGTVQNLITTAKDEQGKDIAIEQPSYVAFDYAGKKIYI